MQDFCRQAVLTYGPANAKVAAEMLSTVTLFVLWATHEEHAPLDYAAIFHPSLMGRYLRSRVSDKKSGSFKSLRSRLFRVASAVTSIEHRKTKRDTTFVPVHEYTAAELAELEGWAATQNTPERRRYAYITLALMGGAGLAMTEALNVRGRDIHRSDDGYTVRVEGRHARTVPVHTEWERYLDEPSSHFVEDDHVLFPGQTPRGRGTTLRTLYRGPHPAPNPQWLRDTWLLQLIRALPLSIIMQAVGTSDVVRFRRYFDTAHLDFAQWNDAVRNPAAYAAGMDNTGHDISAYGDDSWRAAYGKLRDEVAASNVNMQAEPRAVDAAAALKDNGEYGSREWEAAMVQLRGHVDPVNAKLSDAPRPEGRPRPRDRNRGDYDRRPMMATPTADSTAFPAGTPSVPFTRDAASELHKDGDRQPVTREDPAPRRIADLEADRTPKRPRKKSRYEALPPAPDGLTAAVAEDQTDSAASKFQALRAELLAEARRSARGGKR
ncbi:hypothetical protein BIV01_17695 [Curtobacterium sp. MCBA15_013]|nr:hypothetical protein BIV01_17695 [Curtobacterium sp. MCBA15_013]